MPIKIKIVNQNRALKYGAGEIQEAIAKCSEFPFNVFILLKK